MGGVIRFFDSPGQHEDNNGQCEDNGGGFCDNVEDCGGT